MTVAVYLSTAAMVSCVILAMSLGRQVRRNGELERLLGETRVQLIQRIREAELFRMVAEHTNDGIVVQDMQARILWASPSYRRIVRLPDEKLIGRNPLEFIIPDPDRPTDDEIANFRYSPSDPAFHQLALRLNQRGNGDLFWNQHSFSFYRASSGEDRAILVCRDVTDQVEDQKRLQETRRELEHAATHDMLTGVANRTRVMQYCQAALDAGPPETVGMLHFDVDNFKEINDTHGHSAGDAALRHVADRISASVQNNGLVARIGGDEFVLVCPGVEGLQDLIATGEVLRRAIAEPFSHGGATLTCACSVGVACAAPDSTDPEALMLRSDSALYEAKRRGRGRVEGYDSDLHQRRLEEIRLSAQLRRAIEAGDLVYDFQPIHDLHRGQVAGFETLVRWLLPDGSVVPPDDFLPLAASVGLMADLDFLSMDAALGFRQRLEWSGLAAPDIKVGFNASHELLAHPDFMPRLIAEIDGRGLNRGDLIIEVLETTVLGGKSALSRGVQVIAELRAAGFVVLLDDFGTGYAGLSHLTELDITGLKIDRALVKDVLSDPAKARVVEAMVRLGSDLGLEVVAEGVEDEAALNRLDTMGCRFIQGYWIGRPMDAETALSWLAGRPHAIEPIRAAL